MRGQKDLRSMKKGVNWIENQGENCVKLLNKTFWWKIWSTLCSSISGTKCERDNPIFSAERRGQSDHDEIKKICTQSDWKSPKRGLSPWNLHTMRKYRSTIRGGWTSPPLHWTWSSIKIIEYTMSGIVSSVSRTPASKRRGPGLKSWPGTVSGTVTIIIWDAGLGCILALS